MSRGFLLLFRKEAGVRKIWEAFIKFEISIVRSFSTISQSVHWSFFWILFFIAWLTVRSLHIGWYSDSIDLTITIVTTAIIPYLLENSLKNSQGIQTAQQNKQMEMLEDQIELLIKLSESNIALQNKLLSEVAEISDDIDEIHEQAGDNI